MQLTQKKRTVDGYIWKCMTPCRKEVSLRNNSIFESVRVSMTRYLKFMLMWCRNGLQVDIAYATDINKNTSSSWNFDLRIAIQDYLIGNREMLDGYDDNGCSKIVEIDKSLF
jgi:hypothetical protein